MYARMHARTWFGAGMAIAMVAAAGCASDHDGEMGRVDQRSGRAGSSAVKPGVIQPMPDEILPDTHVAAGRLHETQGRLTRAVEQYRLAIEVKPTHVEAHNRLGIVLDKLGRFAEADASFKRAIELAPEAAHLYNNLGFSYVMQGRWPEAEAQFTRALELQPDFVRAQVNLGVALGQQDRFEESLAQFERSLARPDAYFNLGLIYESRRRPLEAARAFKTALRLNPAMVAAQTKLDRLPPDVVSQAEEFALVTASPTPTAARFEPQTTERPSTQPAEDGSGAMRPGTSEEELDLRKVPGPPAPAKSSRLTWRHASELLSAATDEAWWSWVPGQLEKLAPYAGIDLMDWDPFQDVTQDDDPVDP